MLTIDHTINLIRQFRMNHKLSASGLAILAGLSPNALRDLDNPGWSPRADTIRALESVMITTEGCHRAAGDAS